jgi:release factor glutamine methyltransferase
VDVTRAVVEEHAASLTGAGRRHHPSFVGNPWPARHSRAVTRPAARENLVERLRAAGCVFAEDEAALLTDAAVDDEQLEQLVARRVAGKPLELVVGWAGFAGLRVAVAPGVFVPRRRTELLATLAADLARPGAVVVDMCCGTGAVGLVVATRVSGVELHAVEIDPAAVACARANLVPLGGRVHAGDLDAALPDDLAGRVDVLVANAPYVPTGELALMPREAREHEPAGALDGGPDGLDVHRRLAAAAPRWLSPTGSLLVETSDRQLPVTRDLLAAAGLETSVETSDDLGATVVLGTRAGGRRTS